ncbi:MAG: UDP-N-acetylmuramoyl-L-alanyl-D-glutamate--2,6-diaminopimelate ligase [Candidatus Tyrphobacter sp.]
MSTPGRSVALAALLQRLPGATLAGDARTRIDAIVVDSRDVRPGSLFVALRGEHADGHDFITQAIDAGAAAVVVERELAAPPTAAVRVESTRRALSAMAAAFYGDPSQKLAVVGVTGTNGKTTTTRMLAAIANAAGMPCGVIGTIGAEFAERSWKLAHTTPFPQELHALLAEMADAGARAIAMEVSSHALALERVHDVRFACGVLTNVTRDHLDFHGTQEAYAQAKRRLFALARTAALNADDAFGARWSSELRGAVPLLTYSLRGEADLVARDVEVRADGSSFMLDGVQVLLALPARFNVANALAAIAAARLLGIDDATSAAALRTLVRVPGRMERVGAGDVDVVVDYAHTPDALEQALCALREIARGRLAVVFGCGGDRDRGKRPEMGAIAARYAARIYVTSDNPRSEDPAAIARDIAAGVGEHPYVLELNRRAAIERAVLEAQPGDTVLVAGKGHEAYQIAGDRVVPFDDVAVAREALAKRAP